MFQPTALLRLFVAAGGKLFPIVVHLLLRFALTTKDIAYVKLNGWPPFTAMNLRPSSSLRSLLFLLILRGPGRFGRFFGPIVEPCKGSDF